MAISWITALKIIPWSDVVRAAPHIVKGARSLFNSAKQNVSAEEVVAGGQPGSRDEQIVHLHDRIVALTAEQQASAELIRHLAEQNERIVAAIEILRVRTRLLIAVCAILGLLVGTLAIAAMRS